MLVVKLWGTKNRNLTNGVLISPTAGPKFEFKKVTIPFEALATRVITDNNRSPRISFVQALRIRFFPPSKVQFIAFKGFLGLEHN
mmetsp:Transcript_2734/g.6605  ORF Transcript_2734/g.6605 Transcript_2734/m.6605 type:complete len:85 (-) Transcript_2734:540-794(-)